MGHVAKQGGRGLSAPVCGECGMEQVLHDGSICTACELLGRQAKRYDRVLDELAKSKANEAKLREALVRASSYGDGRCWCSDSYMGMPLDEDCAKAKCVGYRKLLEETKS